MIKRLISAIITLAVIMPIIYFGEIPFKIAILLIALFGFIEYVNLETKIPNGAKMISMLCLAIIVFDNFEKTNLVSLINMRLIGIILLIHFCTSIFYNKDKDFNITKCFQLLGLILFLGITFSIFVIVRNIDVWLFLYLISIAIFTDIFAHAIGTLFGKHKVTEISPNKSWEGYIGGTLFGVLGSSIIYITCIDPNINIFLIVLISFILSIIEN